MLNMMIMTLNFSVGSRKYVLIKPDKLKEAKKDQGYIFINKHFISYFMNEIDKLYDLNLQI